MDGVHDLGGKQGFGSVRFVKNAAVFHHDWELRANALYALCARKGLINMDEYRHAIERMEPRHYLAASYYERSLTGLASLLVEKGFASTEELNALAGGLFPLALPGGPGRSQPQDRAQFKPGDRVCVRSDYVSGHVRMPAYIRGKSGVVIIGGGQAGIILGARLRKLGVPTIIVEKNARAGDSWRNRYKSLCLHDPVWYDHLPYLPFPEDWPVFAPKDKLGDWLEMYVKVMELNYWNATSCKKARYNEARGEWEVTVEREGRELVLKPKELVVALGVSGYPNVPHFEGAEAFLGDQFHSSKFPGAEAYRGKKALVLGSNNSAHDICAALWEEGVDTTMIQRSSTHIAPSDSLMELALGGLYSEAAVKNGIDCHKADLIFASIPYKVMAPLQVPVYDEMKKRDALLFERLEKAGFLLDFGVDGSGLFMKYLRRGSGYYIDVGASELIANGSVKLKSAVNFSEIKPRSVVLTDGTELEADLIVYATGYGSMNQWLADLISPQVADRLGKVWGLGSDTPKDPGPWEGELRNMWKPTQVPHLWVQGGNLHQNRHYSQFMALQLKARYEGIPTPVYELAPVHHRA
ncbi:MAG: nitrile hydratase subunit beta [Betaproteobacteria bacterium]|nr:nitrile hydratase subunit beta [Betaproteobacteria bacterium]